MSEMNNTPPEIIPGDRHPDYKGEIAALLRGNLAPGQLRKKLEDYHERDIAEALELLRRDERCRLYALLDAPTLAGVLEYTEDDMPTYLEELGIRKKLEILPLLDPSTAADYLKGLERAQRSALVDLMDDDVKRDLSFLSSFDEDEIGSRMTTDFVSIRADMTVRQAMKELIRQAADTDNISTLYAVDANGVLVGAIDLKELIIARETTALDDILMTSYPYVYADELIEDCVERIRAYSEDSIPVLNADNRLSGALTAQVVAELVADELGEDYAKLGGLTAGEDLEEPLRRSVAKRLPWLVILLGLGLVVSSVVGLFERVVTHLTVIICFQSLVLDMAGNVGTQSLAVTIRVLMDEDVSPRQKLALVGKEARVGLMNGLLLGLLSFGAIGLYLMAAKGAAAAFAFSVSFCTGTALLVSMLLSSIIGTTVPILFKRLGVGKRDAHLNVGDDRLVAGALDFGHLLLGHHAAEVARDDVVVHVKAHVVKAEPRVDDAREDVLARVVLHVVEAALPVKHALDVLPDIERLFTIVHDARRRAAHVEHGCAVDRTVVRRLSAAFRIKGRVFKHDLEALFAFHA